MVNIFRNFEMFYKIYLIRGSFTSCDPLPLPFPLQRTCLREPCTFHNTAETFAVLPGLHIVSNETNGNILRPSV